MNDAIFASLNSSSSSDQGTQQQKANVQQRRPSAERVPKSSSRRSSLSNSARRAREPVLPLAHSHFIRLSNPSFADVNSETRIFLTTPTAPVPNFQEVLTSLFATESKHVPRRDYMETIQNDLSYSMRSILIDWLVEVAEEYQLTTQTLFLAVNYVDRFLSFIPMERSKLQLLGVTSMLLASKYWEIRPPLVDDFVYISDNSYSRAQVITMEGWILKTLKFSLSCVTPLDFARPFMELAGVDKETEPLVDLLLELYLLHPTYILHPPSHIAASAVVLAKWNRTLLPAWPQPLADHCPFSIKTILPLVCTMSENHSRLMNPNLSVEIASTHGGCALKAIREKYCIDGSSNAAFIPAKPLHPLLYQYRVTVPNYS
jgi:cyclin A